MKTGWKSAVLFGTLAAGTLAGALAARAEGPAAQKVDVQGIKEKYWARGSEPDLGVVQNRTYSKEKRLELSMFGGISSTDPFLSVKTSGFTLGFHFNEYFSVHLRTFKSFVNPSTALLTFQNTIHATTNYNPPYWYIGGEASGSVLYGKLSLVGRKILYYDLHLAGGLGRTATESGNYLTPSLGLGQQIYLSQAISLRLDYRLMAYREDIVEKVITSKLGQITDQRYNFTHSVSLGISFLIPFGAPRPIEGPEGAAMEGAR